MAAVVKMASAATVAKWLAEGSAVVIDVREPNEHRAGHIPGAALNPLSTFDPAKVQVDPAKHLVLHCQMGRRCGPASEKLNAAGYSGEIYRLEGGFKAWADAGGKVQVG